MFRIQQNLGRTNNSLESWHSVFNARFVSFHPRLSVFVKIMQEEDDHWRMCIDDYKNSPANGVRGKGMKRHQAYLENDANIREIFNNRATYQPLAYLRALAYRMPNVHDNN
jgi:hypothetical protein